MESKFIKKHLSKSKMGSWKLSENTLKKIQEVDHDKSLIMGIHPNLQVLLKEVKEDEPIQYLDSFEFNDFVEEGEIINFSDKLISRTISSDEEEQGVSEESFPAEELILTNKEEKVEIISNKLISLMHSDELGAKKLLEEISIEKFTKVVKISWDLLKEIDDKYQFVKLLSTKKSSAEILCTEIILPLMNDKESFNTIFEILKPQLVWFDPVICEAIILPLIKDENSILCQDISFFKNFYMSLTIEQKYFTLKLFSSMETIVQHEQLVILNAMVENTNLNDDVSLHVIKMLKSSVKECETDRYFGKILLKITEDLDKTSSPNLISEIIEVYKQFKGIIRVRIKKMLDELQESE